MLLPPSHAEVCGAGGHLTAGKQHREPTEHHRAPEPRGIHRKQMFKGRTVTLKNKNRSNKSLLWLRA